MTNGLTKSAKVTFLPAQPAVPAIAPFAERFFLTPAPRGTYYVREGAGYVLKQASSGGGTTGPKGYRLPANSLNGVPNERGEGEPILYLFPPEASVGFNYIDAIGSTVVTQTITAFADTNGVIVAPPETPANKFLAWYFVLPKQTPIGDSSGLYNNPAGTYPIIFIGLDTLSNGLPREPGNYIGTAQLPHPDGGTRPYSQMYAPSGPNGSYVPVGSVPLPPYASVGGSPYYQLKMTNFPGAPGKPATGNTPVFGVVRAWDAGANSIGTVADNDLFVKFQVGPSLGVKIGFYLASVTRAPANASLLRAAFYCYSTANGFRWSILDDGRQITPANNTYDLTTQFEIRRVGGRMVYLVNGDEVYSSVNQLLGELRVGTTMFSTGDFVL